MREMVSLGLLVVNGMVSVSRRVATGVESAAPDGIEAGLISCFVANAVFVVYCGVRIAVGARVGKWLRKVWGRLWRRGTSPLKT